MWNRNDVAGGLLLAVLAVVTALVIAGTAHAAVSPRQLAHAIDQINHTALGYPKAHTVCSADPAHAGKAICTVNLGRPNLDISIVPLGARCFRAEFWQTGQTVHIRVRSVVQVSCQHAPPIGPSS